MMRGFKVDAIKSDAIAMRALLVRSRPPEYRRLTSHVIGVARTYAAIGDIILTLYASG